MLRRWALLFSLLWSSLLMAQGPGLPQASQAPPPPDSYLFYFVDNPEVQGGEEYTLGDSGFLSDTALYRKHLCIAKLDDPQDKPACSTPMPGIRNGGIAYDVDTQRVYVVMQGSKPEVVSPTGGVSLEDFFTLQKDVDIHSFPLGRKAIETRVADVEKLYTGKAQLLFEICQAVFTRVTHISSQAIESLFQLRETESESFFKGQDTRDPFELLKHENFCRLLALKGDPAPLQTLGGEDPPPVVSKFLEEKKALDDRKPEVYTDQLVAIALFHVLLRLQDIDRAVVDDISQLGENGCSLAASFRLLQPDGNLNLSNGLYGHLWLGTLGGQARTTRSGALGRGFKIASVLPTVLETWRSAMANVSAGTLVPALETALRDVSIPDLLCELEGDRGSNASCAVKSEDSVLTQLQFLIDVSGPSLGSTIPQKFIEKVTEWMGNNTRATTLSSGAQQAFYKGMVGYAKALKQMHGFLKVLAAATKFRSPQLATEMKAFLTGDRPDGSLINTTTFLSFQLNPRAPGEEDNLLFLTPSPEDVSLHVAQQVSSMGRDQEVSPFSCPQLNHTGLRAYRFYLQASRKIHGHERLRKALQQVIPSAEEVAGSESVIDKLRKILRKRKEFLTYFMTEDVSGLVSENQAFLMALLRQELQKPSIDSLAFDAMPYYLERSRGTETFPIEGFSLDQPYARMVFDVVRAARLMVDSHLRVLSGKWESVLSRGEPASQVARRAKLQELVENYLSEEAIKKLLLGCVTSASLKALDSGTGAQGFKDLPLECASEPAETEPADTEIVGYSDYSELKKGHQDGHGFVFDDNFLDTFQAQLTVLNQNQSLTKGQSLPLDDAADLLLSLMDELIQKENAAVQQGIQEDRELRQALWQSFVYFRDPRQVAGLMLKFMAGAQDLSSEIDMAMARSGAGSRLVQMELKRLAIQHYAALAKLHTGMTTRLILLGLILKELPSVIEDTPPSGKLASRGARLAQAREVFLGLGGDPGAAEGVLKYKDTSQLTDKEKTTLHLADRILILTNATRGNSTVLYYPLTRHGFLAAEAQATRTYLQVPPVDEVVLAGGLQDHDDFRHGNFQLRVLTQGQGDETRSALFTSQEGKMQLYDDPRVLQIRPLKIEEGQGQAARVISERGTEGLVFREKILKALDEIPSAPTAQDPVSASARMYDLSIRGQGLPKDSEVGYPGRTWRIYKEDMNTDNTGKLTEFLTKSPRFSMLFEGAYLDTLVFRQVHDAQALRAWTQRLQEGMGAFLASGHTGIRKETWVSESFSPGLTRRAQFKTHVMTLPLLPLLRGFLAADLTSDAVVSLQNNILKLKIEIEQFQHRYDQMYKTDQAAVQQLTQEVAAKKSEFDSEFAKIEVLAEKDLMAFQVLYRTWTSPIPWFPFLKRTQESQDNPYFPTHRYFPEHTVGQWDKKEEPVIHVQMNEFTLWKMADLDTQANRAELLSKPKLEVHYEDAPLIRSHLLGQYQFHPGAMHHVWDDWDGSQQVRAEASQQGCNSNKCQNIYFYYGGSHLMAFNLKDGVWFRSEGWNRLGIEIKDGAKLGRQELELNQMQQVVNRVSGNDLKDHTLMPYRLWLTIPNSPPFFNPLADEWTFQRVFLSREGVGRTKQWMLGWRGFGQLLGAVGLTEGLSPKSFVHVIEALAQPGGEYHLHIDPGLTDASTGQAEEETYQTFRAVLWKNFNDVMIQPVPAQNNFMLTHTLKLQPFKQWQFYQYYENAFPNHESYLTTFFTFDKDRSGDSSDWNFWERSWQSARAEQFKNETPWSEFFAVPAESVFGAIEAKGVLPTLGALVGPAAGYAWSFFHGKAMYYNSSPWCVQVAYHVDGGSDAQRAVLLNNNITPSGSTLERHIVPTFLKRGDPNFQTKFDQDFTALDPTVGPALLNVVPYRSTGNVPGWLYSTLTGTYHPAYQGTGIQNIQNELKDSFGKKHELPPPDLGTPVSSTKPAGLGRLGSTGRNTWIPGMCVPFHTQGAITGMTVVQ